MWTLAPHPGIEPAGSTVEGEILATGSPGKSHESNYFEVLVNMHFGRSGMLQDHEFNWLQEVVFSWNDKPPHAFVFCWHMSGRQDLRVGSLCSLWVGTTFIKVTDSLAGPGALPVLSDKEAFKAPTAPLKRLSARTKPASLPQCPGFWPPCPITVQIQGARLPFPKPEQAAELARGCQNTGQHHPLLFLYPEGGAVLGWAPPVDPGGVVPGVKALGLKRLSPRHRLPGRREPQSFAFHV